MSEVNLVEFGARAGDGSDATPAVRAALSACRERGARRLVLPTGRYDFWPDRAAEHYLFVSNNDEGLKRVVFPLFDLEEMEIDGQGSELVFHSYEMPFAIVNSRNVRLTNLSIEWERPFHSEAIVLAAREGCAELEIPEQFPYRVECGGLVFTGERGDTFPVGNTLEFDTARRETAFRVHDNYRTRVHHTAAEIGARRVRFEAEFTTVPTPGNTLVFQSRHRLCPAIFLDGSADITICNVTLHHAGGMGVIAQRSQDIHLDAVRVTPRPDSGRMVSLTGDATHFVNCRGQILMERCLFENQMDDATNVHGIYSRIARRLSDHELEVELVHPQQAGVTIAAAGETMEIVRRTTLATYHQGTIRAVERLNKSYTRLTFAEALPSDIEAGDAVNNLTWQADLTIRDCTARANRARGFLISTAGRALVENNHLHVPGSGICVEGDANFWFESGAVRDLTIRGNHFDNCLYGVWGRAVIHIHPGIAPEYRGGPGYHRGIVVEGNTFTTLDPRIVWAHSVDGLTVRDNTIQPGNAYPRQAAAEPFQLEACENVVVQANRFNDAG